MVGIDDFLIPEGLDMTDDKRTHPSRTRLREMQKTQLRRKALRIVRRYTLLSGGIGLIPAPLFYQIGVAGVLGKMLYDLSELYGTSMSKQKNKAMIAAILGGAHSEWITGYMRNYIKKVLPGMVAIGTSIARPVVAAGIVYAVGKLFIQHFENGAWLDGASPSNLPHPVDR